MGRVGGSDKFKTLNEDLTRRREDRKRQQNEAQMHKISTLMDLEALEAHGLQDFTDLTINVDKKTNTGASDEWMDVTDSASVKAVEHSLAEMEELPAWLNLENLQQLDVLSASKLRRLPASLANLQFLKLQRCKNLQGLSMSLKGLQGLRSLELLDTNIAPADRSQEDADFMEALAGMSSFERLYLSNSRVPCPSLAVGSLCALKTLQIGNCSASPQMLNLLRAGPSLKELYIEEVETHDLELQFAETVCTLTELQTLVLESVTLGAKLPCGISHLKDLHVLSLSKCKALEWLPESVGALTNLTELNLRETKISKLPDAISSLQRLAAIHLGHCEQLKCLPTAIGSLSNLISLRLSACKQLQDLGPSFEALSNLTELYLDHSALSSNPLELTSFTALQRLMLPCPRQMPNSLSQLEYNAETLKRLLAFLGDLRKDKEPVVCKVQKVVVLGPEMAGKSSLLDSLMEGEGRTREASERTVGIDTTRWFVDTVEDRVVNVFDAGGQRVYQATHGIFLGENDLVLCVSKGWRVHRVSVEGTESAEGAGVRESKPEHESAGLGKCFGARHSAAAKEVEGGQTDAEVLEAADELLEWMDGMQQHVSNPRVIVTFTHLDIGEGGADPGRRFRRVMWALRYRMVQIAHALGEVMLRREDLVRGKLPKERQEHFSKLFQKRDEKLLELDELVLEGVTPWYPGRILKAIPILESRDYEGLEHAYCCLGSGIHDGLERASKITDLVDDIELCHSSINDQLDELLRGEDRCSLSDAREAQKARVRQPLVLGCVAVSSKTNAGMAYLLRCLREATRRADLFPLKPVPTSFAVLERMFLDGRQQRAHASDSPGRPQPSAQLTGWERSIAKEASRFQRTALSELCSRPWLWRSDLEEEVGRSGLGDAEWLQRALSFLHDTGSAFFFPEIRDVVFTQPQWIVDGIKYVIREVDENKSNCELRKLDAQIEKQGFGDLLARFKLVGVLDSELLKQRLWALPKLQAPHPRAGRPKFTHTDKPRMIELMQAFNLLQPTSRGSRDAFLVPAMMQACKLSAGVTSPEWWCPQDSKTADRRLRRVFRCTRRIPFGFWSTLQVSISLQVNQHFGAQVSKVEHASHGSCLEREDEDGCATETVVVTLQDSERDKGDELCVMSYMMLHSSKTATHNASHVKWELFELATSEIHSAAAKRPGILLEEWVPIVADHKIVKTVLVDAGECRPTRGVAEVTSGEGEAHEILFPVPVALAQSSQVASSAASLGPKPRILIFGAGGRHDIDPGKETQDIKNKVKDFFEEPVICPRTTFEVFSDEMAQVGQKQITIVHFICHGEESNGLFFAKDVDGREREPVRPPILSEYLASKHERVECVFLNACSTDGLGVWLRQHNMKNVICWRNPVSDEAAALFSERFYFQLNVLVRDCGNVPDNGYRTAFRLARAALIQWLDEGEGKHVVHRQQAERGGVDFAPVFLSRAGEPITHALELKPLELMPVLQEIKPRSVEQLRRPGAPALATILERTSAVAAALGAGAIALSQVGRGQNRRRAWWIAAYAASVYGGAQLYLWWWRRGEPPADLHDIEETSRNPNNTQGKYELDAFEVLGVKLVYNGHSVWDSLDDAFRLSKQDMIARGFEFVQSKGRPQLRLAPVFLQHVFEVHTLPGAPEIRGYGALFGADGVIVHWVKKKNPSSKQLKNAVQNLRGSAKERNRQLEYHQQRGSYCEGHEYMLDQILGCVEELEEIRLQRTFASLTIGSAAAATPPSQPAWQGRQWT